MNLTKYIVLFKKIILKILIFIFKSLGIAVINTCESVFVHAQISKETFVIKFYPFSTIFIAICLILKLAFLRISKYSTISLDIIFFFSILILVMYHIFKDPENLFLKNS